MSYQKAQPAVKALCDKHGIPYIQESCFTRLVNAVKIMTGERSIKRYRAER